MSRNGVSPRHTIYRRIRNILQESNTKLPPGVRCEDVNTPSVIPPSDGYHEYSSDLGEGENARAILDLNDFVQQPNVRDSINGPNGLHLRDYVQQQARQIRQRNRLRRIQRLRSPHPPSEHDFSTTSEAAPERFGRQGQVGTNGLNLPPPTPVLLNPRI